MKLILGYSINICHKNYLVEPLWVSNTQKLVGLHVFLFATWMDVTVNRNGKSNFFFKICLRGYCTSDELCDCLCIFLKNYNTLVTSKMCFL